MVARGVIALIPQAVLPHFSAGLVEVSSAAALVGEAGIGPVTAAAVLVASSHPGRVRDEAAFAALAGVNKPEEDFVRDASKATKDLVKDAHKTTRSTTTGA